MSFQLPNIFLFSKGHEVQKKKKKRFLTEVPDVFLKTKLIINSYSQQFYVTGTGNNFTRDIYI